MTTAPANIAETTYVQGAYNANSEETLYVIACQRFAGATVKYVFVAAAMPIVVPGPLSTMGCASM